MQNMPERPVESDMKSHEPFEGLIFDCDGTLADTMPLHFVAWQDVLTGYGLRFDEDMFYSFAGQPTVSIVSKLLRQQNLDGDAVKIANEKEQAFVENLANVKPIEPVVAVARHFRKSKPMGVGSGSGREVVFQILEHIGFGEFFDAVVGAEDTTLHKPEPDVFLEVARRIGVEPSACEVFEDADLGVEAGKRAGMAVFDVRTVHQPKRMTDQG